MQVFGFSPTADRWKPCLCPVGRLAGRTNEGGPDLQGVASEGGPDLQGVASEGDPDLQGVASEGSPDLQGVASEGSLLVGLNEGLGNKGTIRLWIGSRPAPAMPTEGKPDGQAGDFCHVLNCFCQKKNYRTVVGS